MPVKSCGLKLYGSGRTRSRTQELRQLEVLCCESLRSAAVGSCARPGEVAAARYGGAPTAGDQPTSPAICLRAASAPRSPNPSTSVVCFANRQRTAGTRRVHEVGNARTRAGTSDRRRPLDLQGKRGRYARSCAPIPPRNLHGKEGVDGSSPSEGLFAITKPLQKAALLLP